MAERQATTARPRCGWIGQGRGAGLGRPRALLAKVLTQPGALSALWLLTPLVLAAFVAWQVIAPAPMLRLGLFRSRTFSVTNLVTLFQYSALNGVMFHLPMSAVSAWGVTEMEVTAAFLPISILIGVLSAPAGRSGPTGSDRAR